jgi:uncharacterized membrane protein
MSSITARYITLTGYFGLIVLLITWYGIMQPAYAALIILLVPLAFPLLGLIRGKPYTYAWMSFLTLLYFVHGIVEAYANEVARPFALLEILASVLIYIGAVVFSRLRSRELKK